MNSKSLAILQYLFFIGMIAVNALANILPLNGLNTGQVSALYPNLFVPAGFTFGIWGIIYFLLAVYVVLSSRLLWQSNTTIAPIKYHVIMAQFFIITCVLNAAWIFIWHQLQAPLSLVIMLIFLFTLIAIYLKQKGIFSKATSIQKLCLQIPFVVYLAWISVATIANTTAVLVFINFSGFGIEPYIWSCTMIIVATLLAVYFGLKEKQWAFCAVICWALFGIMLGQNNSSYAVSNMARICSGIALVALFLSAFNDKKGISV